MKRSATPERRLGGDDDFDLDCPICGELLNDARQAPCCGGLACCECLDHAAEKSGRCPFCRAVLAVGAAHVDVRMERRAANTVRECPYPSCAYRGKRDDLRRHVQVCDKRPLSDIIAVLRVENESLKQQLAAVGADRTRRVAAAEAAASRAEDAARALDEQLAAHEARALRYAYEEPDSSRDAPPLFVDVLRVFGLYAVRFPWSAGEWAREYPLRHRSLLNATLRVRKANASVTVQLVRNSEDGSRVTKQLRVIAPSALDSSYCFELDVPGHQGGVSMHRPPFTEHEFAGEFVKNGAFVVAVVCSSHHHGQRGSR